MLVSDTIHFLNKPPYFTNHSLFMGKIWIPPLLGKISKTHLYTGGVFSAFNYAYVKGYINIISNRHMITYDLNMNTICNWIRNNTCSWTKNITSNRNMNTIFNWNIKIIWTQSVHREYWKIYGKYGIFKTKNMGELWEFYGAHSEESGRNCS